MAPTGAAARQNPSLAETTAFAAAAADGAPVELVLPAAAAWMVSCSAAGQPGVTAAAAAKVAAVGAAGSVLSGEQHSWYGVQPVPPPGGSCHTHHSCVCA